MAVRGARLPVTVTAGRQTVAAQTGSVIVLGEGGVAYQVYDPTGKELGWNYTGKALELLPGIHVVKLKERKFETKIRAGQIATIKP